MSKKYNSKKKQKHEKIPEPFAIKELTHVSWYNKFQKNNHKDAVEFYEKKLEKAPDMPRYNHCMAALKVVEGKFKLAHKYYTETLQKTPGDVMVRSDFALNLARVGKMDESVDQLRKSMIKAPDHPVLRKNMCAVMARKGDYNNALEHATRAIQLVPSDAMNHRNIARIMAQRGNVRSSLDHNLESIRLESNGIKGGPNKPNTEAFRNAAVQIISNGGDTSEAHALMDAARRIEGKREELPTTQRTNEIIYNIMKRKGNALDNLQKQEDLAAEALSIKEMAKSGVISKTAPKKKTGTESRENTGEPRKKR
jgi:tetratricopeptide (TPR) repeat protein